MSNLFRSYAYTWNVSKMAIPDWLLKQIQTNTGLELDRKFGKNARTGRCNKCGLIVLRGLDDPDCGMAATVDPTTLTVLGEVWAVVDGRKTYRLYGTTVFTMGLWYRMPFNRVHSPVGDKDQSGIVKVVAEHRCGYPIPNSMGLTEGE